MERNLLEQLLGIPHFGFTDPLEQFNDETVNILTSDDIRPLRSNLLMPYIGYIEAAAKTLTPEPLQNDYASQHFTEGFRTAIAFILAGRAIFDGEQIDEQLNHYRICDERDALKSQNTATEEDEDGDTTADHSPLTTLPGNTGAKT